MGYSPYPEYKLSTIPWLGYVPEHWEVKKIKHVVTKIGSGKTPKGGAEVYQDEGIMLLRSQNIYDSGLRLDDVVYISDEADEAQANSRVYKDDVLLNITGASIGRSSLVEVDGVKANVNQHVCIFRPEKNKIFPKFLYQLFCSSLAKEQIFSFENGTSREGLNFQQAGALTFLIPPILEQQTIALFLDYKTAQIDALIAKKQALLEKLAEKRTALISQAVTKGLDPNVPMKDSGIEWLGEIPAHWSAKKVKYLTRILRGKFSHRPRNDPRLYDGKHPFIQTGDVASANTYIRSYSQTLNDDGFTVSKKFPAGTLVMTIAANIGDIAIIDFDACFPDSIVGFFPEPNVTLLYLFYLFAPMKELFLTTAVLNTQLNLNIERIGNQLAVLPPEDEQIRIVSFLEGELKKMDKVGVQINNAILKLKEYRTALITNAVTGKIDVRGFEAKTKAA